MKITNLAVLFTLIFFPFFYIHMQNIEYQRAALSAEHLYNLYLDTAVKDATHVLGTSPRKDSNRYESSKQFDLVLEESMEVFRKSLTMNFGVSGDPVAENFIMSFVPAIVVIDYDGFYIYAMDEYADENGHRVLEHVWRSKMPYSYADRNGNSISFTLDDYVHVYERSSNTWYDGTFDELLGETNVAILNDRDLFEWMKRQTIITSVQDSLEYHINRHTQLVYNLGIKYTFTLPFIDNDVWTNTLTDVGMLAFIQGLPIGNRQYNNFSLGGSKLLDRHPIIGTTRNGQKYYFDSRCTIPSDYIRTEIFQTEKDAAKKGYKPIHCLSPDTL